MWPFKKKEPVIINRSSKDGDRLTEDEAKWMEYHTRTGYVFCPDCQKGRLLSGPEGGGAVNCLCPQCGSEFNLSFYNRQIIFPDRISDAGPRSFGDRAFLYREPVEV